MVSGSRDSKGTVTVVVVVIVEATLQKILHSAYYEDRNRS